MIGSLNKVREKSPLLGEGENFYAKERTITSARSHSRYGATSGPEENVRRSSLSRAFDPDAEELRRCGVPGVQCGLYQATSISNSAPSRKIPPQSHTQFIRTRQPPQTRLESLGSSHTWLALFLPSLAALLILFAHPDCLESIKVLPALFSGSSHDRTVGDSSVSKGIASCPKPLSCWGGYRKRSSGEEDSLSALVLDIRLAINRPVSATKFMDVGLTYKSQVSHSGGTLQPVGANEPTEHLKDFHPPDATHIEVPKTIADRSDATSSKVLIAGSLTGTSDLQAELRLSASESSMSHRQLSAVQEMASAMLIHVKSNMTLFNKISEQNKAKANTSSSWWSSFPTNNLTFSCEDIEELVGPKELFMQSEVMFPDPVLDCLLSDIHGTGIFRRKKPSTGKHNSGNHDGNKTTCNAAFSFDAIYAAFYRTGYISGRQLHYPVVDLAIGRELSSKGKEKDRPLRETLMEYADSAGLPPVITVSSQSQDYNLFSAAVYIVLFKAVLSMLTYTLYVLWRLTSTVKQAEISASEAAAVTPPTSTTTTAAWTSRAVPHHRSPLSLSSSRRRTWKCNWRWMDYLLPEQIYIVCILFTLLFWLNPISAALLIDAELHSLRFHRFFGSVIPAGLTLFLNLSESLAGVGLLFLFLVLIDGLKYTPEASEDDASFKDDPRIRAGSAAVGLRIRRESKGSASEGLWNSAVPWLSTDFTLKRGPAASGASLSHRALKGFGAPGWMQATNDSEYAASARNRSQSLPSNGSFLGEGTRLSPLIPGIGVSRNMNRKQQQQPQQQGIDGATRKRVFAIHHPLSPYFCDFIWKKVYLFLFTALFEFLYCSLQFPQLFHCPWGPTPSQQIYVRIASHFVGCFVSFLVLAWWLLIVKAFISTELHLRRIKYRISRFRQMEFRLLLTQILLGIIVCVIAVCVQLHRWERTRGHFGGVSIDSLVFSRSGSSSLAASFLASIPLFLNELAAEWSSAISGFLGGTSLVDYGEMSIWILLKKVALYAVEIIGGAESGPFLCRMFHGMQLAAPVFVVVLSLTGAFILLPPKDLPEILVALTQTSSTAGVQRRGEDDEKHLALAIRDLEGTSHAFVVLERNMPYNEFSSKDFVKIYHHGATVQKRAGTGTGRSLIIFRRKRRIRELFCLETACWLMEASFQAYFPLIRNDQSASEAAAASADPTRRGAISSAVTTASLAQELGFDYFKNSNKSSAATPPPPAPVRPRSASVSSTASTNHPTGKSTNPFDEDDGEEKKDAEPLRDEGARGPQMDVQRLGLRLRSAFENTETSTFGFIAAALSPLSSSAALPPASLSVPQQVAHGSIAEQHFTEGVIKQQSGVDTCSVAEKLVVSFRGSVLANVAMDMKFAQMSLPNLKYRRSYFIDIIREVVDSKAFSSEIPLQIGAGAATTSSARIPTRSSSPITVPQRQPRGVVDTERGSGRPSPGVAFTASASSSVASAASAMDMSSHQMSSSMSSPSTFPSSTLDWLSTNQTSDSNSGTPTSSANADFILKNMLSPVSDVSSDLRDPRFERDDRRRAAASMQLSSAARLLQLASENLSHTEGGSHDPDLDLTLSDHNTSLQHSEDELHRAESGDSHGSHTGILQQSLDHSFDSIQGGLLASRSDDVFGSAQRSKPTNKSIVSKRASFSSVQPRADQHAVTWLSSMRKCIDALPLFRYALPRVHVGFWEAYASVRREFLTGIVSAFCDHYQRIQQLYDLYRRQGASADCEGDKEEEKDIESGTGMGTMTGIKRAADSKHKYADIIREEMAKAIARPLRVYMCGHSLGGALAVLAALDVAVNMSSIEAAIIKVFGPLDVDELQTQTQYSRRGSGSRFVNRSNYTPIPSADSETDRGRWSTRKSGRSYQKSPAAMSQNKTGLVKVVKEWTQPSLAVYSFGAPRIGNATFAALVDRKLKSNYRVQVDNDIVTMVPKILGMYRHAGTSIVVDSEQAGSIIVKPTIVESHLWRPSRGTISSHYLNTYRACLEACFEEEELKEYLQKEQRLSNLSAASRANSFATETYRRVRRSGSLQLDTLTTVSGK